MTTESTKPVPIVAEGEAMKDLIGELESLAEQSNVDGPDRIPLYRFYEELNRIHAEACLRLGEPPLPVRSKGWPGPGVVPDEDDIEDALAYWMLTCSKVENWGPGDSSPEDDVWQEIDEETAEYEQAFEGYQRLRPMAFRTELDAMVAPCRQALNRRERFSSTEARTAFAQIKAECVAAISDCLPLTADQFQDDFELRTTRYRRAFDRPRVMNRTELLAEAAACLMANLTEISTSEDFPGMGLLGSVAWGVAAYEVALHEESEFLASRFWRLFDLEIDDYESVLAEHQTTFA